MIFVYKLRPIITQSNLKNSSTHASSLNIDGKISVFSRVYHSKGPLFANLMNSDCLLPMNFPHSSSTNGKFNISTSSAVSWLYNFQSICCVRSCNPKSNTDKSVRTRAPRNHRNVVPPNRTESATNHSGWMSTIICCRETYSLGSFLTRVNCSAEPSATVRNLNWKELRHMHMTPGVSRLNICRTSQGNPQ